MVLKVRIYEGDITEKEADVCVSSLHRTKNMTKGPLAKAVSMKAGPSVQKALNAHIKAELSFGDVVSTPPGNLTNFTELMFVCLDTWRDGNEKVLFKSVVECLKQASEKKFRSIVFPALGMGGLHYPPYEVAIALLEGIISYIGSVTETSLETIYITLHDPNMDSQRTFVQVTMAFLRGMEKEMELAWGNRGQNSLLRFYGHESFDGLERTRPEEPSQRSGETARSLPSASLNLNNSFCGAEISLGFSLRDGTARIGINLSINVPGALKKMFEITSSSIKSYICK